MTISPVIDAPSASFPSIFGADSPFTPFSRTKPLIEPSQSHRAHTTNTSAIGEFVIHILVPVSRNAPLTFSAFVRIEPGSEPESGSVKPKQPIQSPFASLGRYFLFWASLP
jgi:hypothetical protein